MDEAEKRLVSQLGAKVCIYTKVCLHHAEKANRNKVKDRFQIDWDEIFRWVNIFRISLADKHNFTSANGILQIAVVYTL